MSSYDSYIKDYTEEQAILSCKEMAKSVIAYCGYTNPELMKAEELSNNSYLKEYAKKIGNDKVIEILNDLISQVDHIETNVYTDCEGLSYNSIIWKEVK